MLPSSAESSLEKGGGPPSSTSASSSASIALREEDETAAQSGEGGEADAIAGLGGRGDGEESKSYRPSTSPLLLRWMSAAAAVVVVIGDAESGVGWKNANGGRTLPVFPWQFFPSMLLLFPLYLALVVGGVGKTSTTSSSLSKAVRASPSSTSKDAERVVARAIASGVAGSIV